MRVRFNDGSVALVCIGGPTRTILAAGRVWYFEMHHVFGPMPINRRTGRERAGTQAFWDAVTLWAQQGERVDPDGICQYEQPAPKLLYHLGGRNYTEDPQLAARFGVTEPAATVALGRTRRKKETAGNR